MKSTVDGARVVVTMSAVEAAEIYTRLSLAPVTHVLGAVDKLYVELKSTVAALNAST